MRNFLLLALAITLTGCGAIEALGYLETADDLTQSGADMGLPYLGIANMATGFLVEFVRGRIEKQGILKQAGALYRGVDAHLDSLDPEEKKRAIALMKDSVTAVVGKKRYEKANKLLKVAKSVSSAA